MAPQRRGDLLERINHEIQRPRSGEGLDAVTTELLLFFSLCCRQKRLWQHQRILDQVRHIKNQPAPAGFAMENRKTMGQSQYPGCRGAKAIGQVVAMIQKTIGWI